MSLKALTEKTGRAKWYIPLFAERGIQNIKDFIPTTHLMTPPLKQGLYDPTNEHENCGMGFIVDMKGRKSHDIVRGALEICVNLDHHIGPHVNG